MCASITFAVNFELSGAWEMTAAHYVIIILLFGYLMFCDYFNVSLHNLSILGIKFAVSAFYSLFLHHVVLA